MNRSRGKDGSRKMPKDSRNTNIIKTLEEGKAVVEVEGTVLGGMI